MNCYLQNHRIEAFDLILKVDTSSKEGLKNESRDTSSILRSVRAIIELIEGLLSGSAETISKSLDEFWAAEKLANDSKDREWLGNRISRGLSYMFGGLVQLFIGSYVKASFNLTFGYKLIRSFEKDVVNYSEESDCDLIRSLGLLVLALVNFFAIILPPSVVAVGEMLGVGPSQSKFTEYLRMCSEENGSFSYMAKLIEVYSVINSKNFTFSKISQNDLSRCRTLMDECLAVAPNSVVIRVMNASVCLGEGRSKEAIDTLSSPEISEVINRPEWSTMRLAVAYKLGVAYICRFEFEKASKAFSSAARSIQSSGGWHYIPFMRALEGVSFLAAVSQSPELYPHVSSIRNKVLDIFMPCYQDRDLTNTIVLPGDYWGSRMGHEMSVRLNSDLENDEKFSLWLKEKNPISDIMFVTITCLYQFDKVSLDMLKQFIESVKNVTGSGKLEVVRGEYYRRIERYNKSVAAFDEALSIADGTDIDKDSVIGFSLVFQGAALCKAGEKETSIEVLKDLDEEMAKNKSVLSWKTSAPKTISGIKPGNLVKPLGGEFDLILSLRRNGLKRLIDES